MPRRLPSGFADVYAAVAQTLLKEIGDPLAAEAGPPASLEVSPITEPVRAKAWNEPHPEATDRAMMELAEQRLAEHLAGGMDDEEARRAVAEDLTHYRYRNRMRLYTAGTVSWAEQVKEATRLSRTASRHPTPPPPLPPAQLPGLPPMAAMSAGGQTGGLSAAGGQTGGQTGGLPQGLPAGGMPPPPEMQAPPPPGMPPQGMPPMPPPTSVVGSPLGG